jgi:hypothetical protein
MPNTNNVSRTANTVTFQLCGVCANQWTWATTGKRTEIAELAAYRLRVGGYEGKCVCCCDPAVEKTVTGQLRAPYKG